MARSVYIICTTPRSGSGLLSDALAATQKAGDPREWFNPVERQRWRALWRTDHDADLTAEQYLRVASQLSTTPNGVSGIKLHFYQLEYLKEAVAHLDGMHALSPQQCLVTLFPRAKYLWLRRRDTVAQAVSLRLACATSERGTTERSRTSQRLRFDAGKIAQWEAALQREDQAWATFFHEHAIEPETMYFEELAADYAGSVTKTLAWLGVDGAAGMQIDGPRSHAQSHALTADWIAKYESFREGKRIDAAAARPRNEGSSFAKSADRKASTISDDWKRWIVHARAAGKHPQEIVEILQRNGYGVAAARRETRTTFVDPYADLCVRLQARLQVETSLARVRAEVAAIDPDAQNIPRIAAPARDEFRSRYYAANRACVLVNIMREWKAPAVWTPDYMRRTIGEHLVDVTTAPQGEVPRRHETLDQGGKMMFGDLIDKLNEEDVPPDFALLPRNRFLQNAAAKPLFGDFTVLPYLDPQGMADHTGLSMVPRGYVTRLRRAAFNAFHAQVAGRTRYRLVPALARPDDRNGVSAFTADSGMDVTLAPGEVLFVPVGWLHQATSLDVGIALRFTNFVFRNSFSWRSA